MRHFTLLLLLALVGCSSGQINVDLDSCAERGKIDGVRVGQCQPAKMVK